MTERNSNFTEGNSNFTERNSFTTVNLSNETSVKNINNLNQRINKEITEGFANDNKIIKKIDKSREECYEECLKNIKDNYEEFYNKINNLYNEYYSTSNKNYINLELQNINDEKALILYKNFIKIMVLGLNKSDVKLLVETVYNNDLSFDSFYSYFKEDIELSSKKDVNGKILEYDLKIKNIDNNDPRLKDHIYMYYEFFIVEKFREFIGKLTLIDFDERKNKIKIFKDIDNKKIILSDNITKTKISINIYYFLNNFYKDILKYNEFSCFYVEIYNFLKIFIEDKRFNELYYFDFYLDFMDYFQEQSRTFIKSTTEYNLGERSRPRQGFIKNTYFNKNIFSIGKFNIISYYLLFYRKYEKNSNYDLELILRLYYDIINNNISYLLDFLKNTENINIFKTKNLQEIKLELASVNNADFVLFDKLFKNPQNPNNRYFISYFNKYKNLYIDYINKISNFFNNNDNYLQNFANTNYIKYFLNLKIKLIQNTYYFNLSQYPVLFTIEDNKFSEFDKLKKEGKIKKSFYPLIDIIENPDKFKENNKNLVLCILNFYNSQLNSNSINQYLQLDYNNKNTLLNTYTTNNSRNIDNKVNFIIQDIFYILRAQYSIFDICKFFYYFNKLVEIKNEKYLSKSINNILFEKVKEEKDKYSILKNQELNSSRTRLARINRYLSSIFAMLNNGPTNMEKVTNENVKRVYNHMNREISMLDGELMKKFKTINLNKLEGIYQKQWIKSKDLKKYIDMKKDMIKAKNIIRTKEFNYVNEKGNPTTIRGLNGLLAEKKKLEKEYNNLVKGIQSKEELGDIKLKYRIQQLNELNKIVSLPEIIEMIYVIKEVKQRKEVQVSTTGNNNRINAVVATKPKSKSLENRYNRPLVGGPSGNIGNI